MPADPHPSRRDRRGGDLGNADARALLPGVGTGENLNEHVTGARWPAPDERLEMLEEAIEVMPPALGGRRADAASKHYRRPRPHLRPAGAAAGDRRRRREDGRGRPRGTPGTGSSRPRPTPSWSTHTAPPAATARLRPADGLLGREVRTEPPHCASRLAEFRHPRPRRAGPPLPEDFEALAQLVTEEQISKDIVYAADADLWRSRIEVHRSGLHPRLPPAPGRA